MRKTDIRINGKVYQVICDADQVDHLRQLSDEVDARAKKISASTPHANETMLLLFTCLTLADELYEARSETGILHEHLLRTEHEVRDLFNDHKKMPHLSTHPS